MHGQVLAHIKSGEVCIHIRIYNINGIEQCSEDDIQVPVPSVLVLVFQKLNIGKLRVHINGAHCCVGLADIGLLVFFVDLIIRIKKINGRSHGGIDDRDLPVFFVVCLPKAGHNR